MSQFRVNNLEGHYTIKILSKLPKRGNANWLYSLKKDNLSVFYIWTLKNEYEKISLSDSISSITSIQAGVNVTIAGSGIPTDPYVINAVPETAQQTPVTPVGNLTSTNVQDALEELQSDFDSISNAEENVQSDWNQTDNTQDDFILNKPTNTSDFTNDGADGSNPFITLNDVPNAPEYTLSPISGTNTLDLLRNGVSVSQIDLTSYLDDTNLSRITTGVLNETTGILTVTRDDSTTFVIDLSNLLPVLTPISVQNENGVEQYTFLENFKTSEMVYDAGNQTFRPRRSWTFNIDKFTAAGATAGNWHGLTNFSTSNPFGVNTNQTDINLITNPAVFARFHFAPVDCYVSMVQVSVNGNHGFGIVAAQGTVSTDTRVIYEGATSNQSILETFLYDGTNTIIPAGYMFRPVLLYSGGGVFGSFSITITEI